MKFKVTSVVALAHCDVSPETRTANVSNILKQHGNMIQHIDKQNQWIRNTCPDCMDLSRTSHWNTSYNTVWTDRKQQDKIVVGERQKDETRLTSHGGGEEPIEKT